jgi:peptide-methionine (S)-S-oxide reductase
VVGTRVGYAGGTTAAPTYHGLGDHSEAIEVGFDPAGISYTGLLNSFWEQHIPRHPSYSRQYRSAVFYANSAQRDQAVAAKERIEHSLGGELYTAIEAAGVFTPAEDYHQKYYLQHNPRLMELLLPLFPNRQALFDSTLAARLNAFLGGNPNQELVFQACNQAGFPPQVIEEIDLILRHR